MLPTAAKDPEKTGMIVGHPDPTPARPMKYGADLDDLLSELNTPKQNFEPPTLPNADPTGPNANPWTQPRATPMALPTWEQDELKAPPLTREEAQRQGERWAKTADITISFLASFYAKEDDTRKYKASPGEVQDLAAAFADLSAEYSLKINPWLNVTFLLLAIYVPKLIQASNDRRINLMNSRIEELEEKLGKLEKQKADAEGQKEKAA